MDHFVVDPGDLQDLDSVEDGAKFEDAFGTLPLLRQERLANASELPSSIDQLIQTVRDVSLASEQRHVAMNALLELSEAPAGDLARFLAGKSLSLTNPLNDTCSSYQKLMLVQCLLCILRDENKASTFDMRESGMNILRNLSRFDLNRIYLYGIPRLVDTLLHTAQSGESTKIRELALVTLNNLALDEFIAAGILDRPGFLEVFMAGAESGETPEIRRWSLGNIRNLAVASVNALRMCDPPFIADEVLVRCIKDEVNCAEVKETALWALVNLTCGGNNRTRLFAKSQLVEALVGAARSRETQRYALRCLLSFCYAEENVVPLYQFPRFIETVLECVTAIEKCICIQGKMINLMEDSFRILHEVLLNETLARDVVKNHRVLLYSLLNLYNTCANSFLNDLSRNEQLERLKVRSWALTLFRPLGFNKQRLQYINIMATLSAVRGVPRLGRNSHLRQLTIEHIRELGEFIKPLATEST